MPRDWRDLTVDEADGLPRYNLIDGNGNVVASNVKVELASKVIQDGDRAGALAFNRVTELDDDGTPLLRVDAGVEGDKKGTIQVYRSGWPVPSTAKPGEVMVARSTGNLFAADGNGQTHRHALYSELETTQTALTQHAGRTDNPHGVTRGQLGAAAATDLTGHVNSRANPHVVTKAQVGLGSVDNVQQATKAEFNTLNNTVATHTGSRGNPHGVTAAQTGAMSNTGGVFTGPVSFQSVYTSYNAGISQEQAGSVNIFTIRTDGASRTLLRTLDAYAPHYASNTTLPSDRELKQNLEPASDEFMGIYDIPLYTYNYKKDSGFDDEQRHFGFMAQEVDEIYPDTAWKREDGTVEGINKSEFVPYLMAALQYERKEREKEKEQREKLEARIEALEKKERK